jgi:hypothetical protein
MRRARWIALALVVLLAVGAVALVATAKPRLDDDRSAVDSAWKQLRGPLAFRYGVLQDGLTAFEQAGGTGVSIATDLHRTFREWDRLRARHGGDVDEGGEVAIANELESLGARLRAFVGSSDRFKRDAGVTSAVAKYHEVTAPGLIDAYNRAARRYQDDRDSVLRKPVARVLGYDQRPEMVPSA